MYIEDYINNYIKILDLSKEKINLKPVDFINRIQELSKQMHFLMNQNNELLKIHVLDKLRNDYELNDEDREELQSFAGQLSGYSNNLDPSLASEIYDALLRDAINCQNDKLIIKYSYLKGISLYYAYFLFDLTEKNILKSMKNCFEKAYSYFDRIDEFDVQTQKYIFTCMHNRTWPNIMSSQEDIDIYMSQCKEEWKYVFDDENCEKYKDADLIKYRLGVSKQILRIIQEESQEFAGAYKDEVTAARRYAKQFEIESVGQDDKMIIDIRMLRYDYYIGNITALEFVQKIDTIYTERNPQKYDIENINLNVVVPYFAIIYIRKTNMPIDKIKEKNDIYMTNIMTYINNFNNPLLLYKLNREIINIVRSFDENYSNFDFRNLLDDLITRVHLPTIVHSNMVSLISVEITKMLIENNYQDELFFNEKFTNNDTLKFVEKAGLFHDVGKILCIKIISQYARNIFPNEFKCIMNHSYLGYNELNRQASTHQYAESALLHHLWYNKAGGYILEFKDFKPKHPLVVNIISIADALDAGTDNIGRCYSNSKSIETIIDELISLSGSRYNKEIVDIISTKENKQKLIEIIEGNRLRIYQKYYLNRK